MKDEGWKIKNKVEMKDEGFIGGLKGGMKDN